MTTTITGGAGFIGTNLAHRVLSSGGDVVLIDDLSRPGVGANLRWLQERHSRLDARIADVRDAAAVRDAIRGARQVFHLAAQVAVTTSLAEPLRDFEVNARGTLNLLEQVRELPERPSVVYTSTNKVYGSLSDVQLMQADGRYEPVDDDVRAVGIGEDHALEFRSPYGCSKGAADQYVLDSAHTFGVPAVVLRMSCIYGPHQYGSEDQGWVCHLLLSALRGEPITVYGDGHQVRDLLFVDDLVTALRLTADDASRLTGQAFNIGGGPAHAVSVLEVIALIEDVLGRRIDVTFGPWRTGDQRYYVSDARRFGKATGWAPATPPAEGIERLRQWLVESGVASPRGQRATPSAPAPVGNGRGRRPQRTMDAAVLAGGGTVRVARAAVPDPGPGQIRFRVEGCGVCGSDLPVWEGRSWFRYPHDPGAPGHEPWGLVDAVGEGVEGVKEGDRVAALSYRALAEYDVARAADVVPLPPTLDGMPVPAEALGCAMSASARSGIGPGDWVCVIGIGFMGAVMTRLAVRAGARVIAVSRRPFALEVARKQGAVEALAMSDVGEVARDIADLTDGALCDVVIEATGSQQPLDLAGLVVREGGRLVLAGFHQDGLRSVDMCSWNWRGLDIVNAHERDPAVRTESMRRAIDAVAAGVIDLSSVGVVSFSLADVERAFGALASRPDGFLKALVRP